MESRRESSSNGKRSYRGGIEANTLAILGIAELHKDSQEADDDRIDFLEAVRTTSLVPENGIPPTDKMLEAVFQILKTGQSLELILSSYELLNDIEKRFPRGCMSKSSSNDSSNVVVVNEAWSPFRFISDIAREAAQESSGILFNQTDFHELIRELPEVMNKANIQGSDTKSLRIMLLFQYLVNILGRDLDPRFNVYKETMHWSLLRESLLNMLLGSRKVSYKALTKDCLFTLCGLFQVHARIINDSEFSKSSLEHSYEGLHTAIAIVLPEVLKSTCISMRKLLIMIMELDNSKKQADMEGQTTRADGVRSPLVEIILDELTYDRDILCTFLQVFNEPKWKVEIVVHFFLKYIAKPYVRSQRSKNSSVVSTLSGVLKWFSNSSSMGNIIKKIDIEVAQLLLAHAFQACLSISSQEHHKGNSDWNELIGGSLVVICENIIAAFNSLRSLDENIEISQFGKEALFTAGTILSTLP